jgi:hypothetical protein
VLVSEIYGIVAGADLVYVISSIITKVIEQLGLLAIPIIVYTNSYSLYKYLVKLSTTKEKRLIIDIIAL